MTLKGPLVEEAKGCFPLFDHSRTEEVMDQEIKITFIDLDIAVSMCGLEGVQRCDGFWLDIEQIEMPETTRFAC